MASGCRSISMEQRTPAKLTLRLTLVSFALSRMAASSSGMASGQCPCTARSTPRSAAPGCWQLPAARPANRNTGTRRSMVEVTLF
jgi:hypothetical protein